MAKINEKAQLEELELWSRQGFGARVRKFLNTLQIARVSDDLCLPLANLARRNNLPLIGLRLLHKRIYGDKKLLISAKPDEIAEYSVSLLNIGARTEAKKLLDGLDAEKIPSVHLYSSFVEFSSWEYERAIPRLKKYIEAAKEDYQILVGKINLAASLVFVEAVDEAEALLAQLRDETKKEKHFLLFGNSLEISAQLALSTGNYKKAEVYLEEANEILKTSQNLNDFFVKKWKIVLNAHKCKGDKSSIKDLRDLRKKSVEIFQWETVRECDYFEALITENEKLFRRVYWGTPYSGYRRRMLSQYWKKFVEDDNYLLTPLQHSTVPGKILDLENGEYIDGNNVSKLKKGFVLHRALQILSRDFYHPLRVAAFFSELFPEDFFNPYTSVDRVHQAVRRLRIWLGENKVPVELIEDSGQYFLRPLDGGGIRLQKLNEVSNAEEELTKKMHSIFGEGFFNASEACLKAGISRSAFHRWSRESTEKGVITKEGAGRGIKYRFYKVPGPQSGHAA